MSFDSGSPGRGCSMVREAAAALERGAFFRICRSVDGNNNQGACSDLPTDTNPPSRRVRLFVCFFSFETVLSALFDTPVGNRPVGKFQCSRRRGTQPRNRVVVKIRYPHPDAVEGKIDRTMSPWLNPSVARKLHGCLGARIFSFNFDPHSLLPAFNRDGPTTSPSGRAWSCGPTKSHRASL